MKLVTLGNSIYNLDQLVQADRTENFVTMFFNEQEKGGEVILYDKEAAAMWAHLQLLSTTLTVCPPEAEPVRVA